MTHTTHKQESKCRVKGMQLCELRERYNPYISWLYADGVIRYVALIIKLTIAIILCLKLIWWKTHLKGILHQQIFYRPNLIFQIVTGCGKARFGRRGQKNKNYNNIKLKILVSKFVPWDLKVTHTWDLEAIHDGTSRQPTWTSRSVRVASRFHVRVASRSYRGLPRGVKRGATSISDCTHLFCMNSQILI